MVRERSTGRSIRTQSDDVLRLCVATRIERSPADLIRFVAGPDRVIVPDLARRLPGRGVWVSADRKSVERAVASRAFAKSLKSKVEVGSDLPDRVEALMLKRVIDALSLANKAGAVTTGFEKISRRLAGGDVAALLHGSDAATDGCEKLDRKLRAISAGSGQGGRNTPGSGPIVAVLTVEQMSLAIGRPNVVHAALNKGGASDRFLTEAGRLERYRLGDVHRVASCDGTGETTHTAKLDA